MRGVERRQNNINIALKRSNTYTVAASLIKVPNQEANYTADGI